MNWLVALKVFVVFLLPLSASITSTAAVWGWQNGLSFLFLSLLYLLNSLIVVLLFYFLARWAVNKPRIKKWLEKLSKKWQAQTKKYLGRYGSALGIMLISFLITWWAAVLVGLAIKAKGKTIYLMAILGDFLYFIIHFSLLIKSAPMIVLNTRFYLLIVLLISLTIGLVIQQVVKKITK